MRALGSGPVLVGVALVTGTIAGCTAGSSADADCPLPTASSTPALPAPSGPAYAGPAGVDFLPWTTLIDEVPLSIDEGDFGGNDYVGDLVPAPDGDLVALLETVERHEVRSRLLELGPTWGGPAVVGAVDVPVEQPYAVHALPDGRIAVVGALSSDGRLLDVPDIGVTVLDPATRRFDTTVVEPSESGATADDTPTSSTLSPDGRVLYLAASVNSDREGTTSRELAAIDPATGGILARRDLDPDVAALVPLPERASLDVLSAGPSGVAAVFQGGVGGCGSGYGAAVLQRYTPRLEPAGPPVQLAGPSTDTYTGGLVHTGDGSLLVARTSYHGDLALLGLRPGGARTTELGQWQSESVAGADDGRTAVLLDLDGVRSVDLSGQEEDVVVPLPCLDGTPLEPDSGENWTGITGFATTGDRAVVLGVCDPEDPTPWLWVLGR